MEIIGDEGRTRDPFQTELLDAVKKRASKVIGDDYNFIEVTGNRFDSEVNKKMSKYQSKGETFKIDPSRRSISQEDDDKDIRFGTERYSKPVSSAEEFSRNRHVVETSSPRIEDSESIGTAFQTHAQEKERNSSTTREYGRENRSNTFRLENELEMLFSSSTSLQKENNDKPSRENNISEKNSISRKDQKEGNDEKKKVDSTQSPVPSPRKPKPRPRSAVVNTVNEKTDMTEEKRVAAAPVESRRNSTKRNEAGSLLDALFESDDKASSSNMPERREHTPTVQSKGKTKPSSASERLYDSQDIETNDRIGSHGKTGSSLSRSNSVGKSKHSTKFGKGELGRSLSGDDLESILQSDGREKSWRSTSKPDDEKHDVSKQNMKDDNYGRRDPGGNRQIDRVFSEQSSNSIVEKKEKKPSRLQRSKSNASQVPSKEDKLTKKDVETAKKHWKATIKRSASLTNISNIRPKSAEDIQRSGHGNGHSNALSIRERVYYEWLQKKTLNNTMSAKEQAEKAQQEEKEKEEERKQRKVMAEKTFSVWAEKKEHVIKSSKKVNKEEIAKQKEQEEEQLQKKLDGKKFYENWKQKKDDQLKVEFKRKQREARRKKQEQEKEKAEKKMSAKKVFDNWKDRKEDEIKKVVESKKKIKKEEHLEKMYAYEKKKEAARAYESWKERKETSPRQPSSPSLTQRSWCPSGRRTKHAIPEKVQPVVLRPERSRTLSASARLQTTRTLR